MRVVVILMMLVVNGAGLCLAQSSSVWAGSSAVLSDEIRSTFDQQLDQKELESSFDRTLNETQVAACFNVTEDW